jgi:hypothetical protein
VQFLDDPGKGQGAEHVTGRCSDKVSGNVRSWTGHCGDVAPGKVIALFGTLPLDFVKDIVEGIDPGPYRT